jgi:glycosyltransferase involved in cell wall biosynthesis
MRILVLNHNVVDSGGTYFRAFHFARHLAARGHDVTLLTISARARVGFRTRIDAGVRIVESPDLLRGQGRTGWDPWDTAWRALWVLGGRYDVVHAFDCRPAVIIPALVVRATSRARLVIDWADWWGRGGTIAERSSWVMRVGMAPLETFFEERFRRYANQTTAINTALGERVLQNGVDRATVTLLPNGSDVHGMRPMPTAEARRTVELPDDGILLGHLGALHGRDGELLLDAFRAIVAQRPTARLLLMGNHRVAWAAAGLPAGSVIDLGRVDADKLNAAICACDALILALRDSISNRGRWPSKINDYMAAGRPTIATAVGNLRQLFDEHQIGRLAAADADSIAEAALALIDDEAERSRCGAAARQAAETTYAWERLTDRLEAVYARALAG